MLGRENFILIMEEVNQSKPVTTRTFGEHSQLTVVLLSLPSYQQSLLACPHPS